MIDMLRIMSDLHWWPDWNDLSLKFWRNLQNWSRIGHAKSAELRAAVFQCRRKNSRGGSNTPTGPRLRSKQKPGYLLLTMENHRHIRVAWVSAIGAHCAVRSPRLPGAPWTWHEDDGSWENWVVWDKINVFLSIRTAVLILFEHCT